VAHGSETAIQVFDGGERFFLPHALPIKESDGQSIGVTLVLADVTALRRLDEMKSNLLAVVSHELRTPLTALRMATHLLVEEKLGPLTPKQVDLAMTARDEAGRLHTIVEGLLNISRLESGRALLDLKPEEPQGLVDEAIAAVATAYRDQGVALDANLPGDLPRVQADRVRIAHVFANLLGNALKYTPRGGQVRITAQRRQDMVEFQVADSGCGIPAEHRLSIFERFYRIPGQTIAGAGLGLAIAKEIVQAHGGVIWLAEQDTPGSAFCFSLPVAA
jgi:NtrC-family two-component system sensor histidine kinase KinB